MYKPTLEKITQAKLILKRLPRSIDDAKLAHVSLPASDGNIQPRNLVQLPKGRASNDFLRPNDIVYPEEQVEDWQGAARGAFLVLSLIGLPEIMDSSNSVSSRNRAAEIDRTVRALVKVANIQNKQLSLMSSSSMLTKESLHTLSDQVNQDHGDLRVIKSKLIVFIAKISALSVDINRDTDCLKRLLIDINRSAVGRETLALCFNDDSRTDDLAMVELKFTSSAILITVREPIPDPKVSIFKISPFVDWVGPDTYRKYNGPNFIMRDEKFNCSKFIVRPEKLSVRTSCSTKNASIDFDNTKYWAELNPADPDYDSGAKIIHTDDRILIQCHPHDIRFHNFSLTCPREPFSLPVHLNFTITSYDHRFVRRELVLPDVDDDEFKLVADNTTDAWQANYINIIKKNFERFDQNAALIGQLEMEKNSIISKLKNGSFFIEYAWYIYPFIGLLAFAAWSYLNRDNLAETMRLSILSNISGNQPVRGVAAQTPAAPTNINIHLGHTITKSVNKNTQRANPIQPNYENVESFLFPYSEGDGQEEDSTVV